MLCSTCRVKTLNSYKIVVGKLRGRRHVGRPNNRCEDSRHKKQESYGRQFVIIWIEVRILL
jgi:hypothetical protein